MKTAFNRTNYLVIDTSLYNPAFEMFIYCSLLLRAGCKFRQEDRVLIELLFKFKSHMVIRASNSCLVTLSPPQLMYDK